MANAGQNWGEKRQQVKNEMWERRRVAIMWDIHPEVLIGATQATYNELVTERC